MAELSCGGQAAVTRYEDSAFVDQQRVDEAECLNTGYDLLNLFPGMGPCVSRVGLNTRGGQILNFQIVQVLHTGVPLLEIPSHPSLEQSRNLRFKKQGLPVAYLWMFIRPRLP